MGNLGNPIPSGQWFTQVGVSLSNVTLVHDGFSGQLHGFGFVEVNTDEGCQPRHSSAEWRVSDRIRTLKDGV